MSLPDNSVDLAKAAMEGGADALKVHINTEHKAANKTFGTFTEEREKLAKIIKAVKIPVGLVLGTEVLPDEAEMDAIKDLGFDYFDVLQEFIPDWLYKFEGMGRMVALDERYTFDRIMGLAYQGAQMIEAAVVPKSGYGERVQIGDLKHYISIASSMDIPVVVPTQREILPKEIPILTDTGIKGIIIGAIVTGKTPHSIEKATAEFRYSIDNLE
ncbi:MAG: hypothetical protein V1843_00850 [bacterium]